MQRKSGVRIDEKDDGSFELIYMGVFSSSIPSQSLFIRSFVDLEDIYYHLGALRAEIKYARKEIAHEGT